MAGVLEGGNMGARAHKSHLAIVSLATSVDKMMQEKFRESEEIVPGRGRVAYWPKDTNRFEGASAVCARETPEMDRLPTLPVFDKLSWATAQETTDLIFEAAHSLSPFSWWLLPIFR